MSDSYIKGVTTLELNSNRCAGCGMCVTVCPHAVLGMVYGVASIVNRDACMECGACAQNCPVGAITVRAGVGCAAGVLNGILKGTEPSCDCSGGGACCG